MVNSWLIDESLLYIVCRSNGFQSKEVEPSKVKYLIQGENLVILLPVIRGFIVKEPCSPVVT
jgi:hypothetical protein